MGRRYLGNHKKGFGQTDCDNTEKYGYGMSSGQDVLAKTALEWLMDAVMKSETKSLTKKEIVAAYEGR